VQNLGPAEGAWQMQEREKGEMSGGFESRIRRLEGPMKTLTRVWLRYDWDQAHLFVYY
jgi:hypothetical protein